MIAIFCVDGNLIHKAKEKKTFFFIAARFFYETSKSWRVVRHVMQADDIWSFNMKNCISFLHNCVQSGNLEVSLAW